VGYEIVLPASAIPGWPADVVLPPDPAWKHDSAGSVRRRVRDGVDVPLASLFVQAARPTPSDADGTDRARSTTEAFLYQRLETLAETKGRFRINVELPIAFDGLGRLEVGPPVCRRTGGCGARRPAASRGGGRVPARPTQGPLAAGNGYLVFRFLAEDLGKELDMVLDALLRALRHRQSAAPLNFSRRSRT
jgi:hypothetical protein